MKNSTIKRIWIIAALAVSISLITLIALYLSSPNVVTRSLGGPEEFGQFGDMIGGVLNPIFGFLTVILLIQTYNIAHSDNLKESRKSARDEIKLMITEFSELLEKRKNERVFALSAAERRTSLVRICNLSYDTHQKELVNLLQIITDEPDLDLDDVKHRKNKIEISSMLDMRLTIVHVIELYLSLIDKNENDTLNAFTFIRLDDFLYTQKNHFLITQAEYSMHIDRAIEKYGKSPKGFTPKYETRIHSFYVSVETQIAQSKASITNTLKEK